MSHSAEERNKMALLAKQGSRSALEALCASFTKDIGRASAAHAERSTTLDADDLAQEGYLILMEALEAWEPEKAPFEAFVRTRLKHMLKKRVQSDAPYYLPSNVGGAVRQVRALEASWEEADLAAIAKRWNVKLEHLAQALALDADLGEVLLRNDDAN